MSVLHLAVRLLERRWRCDTTSAIAGSGGVHSLAVYVAAGEMDHSIVFFKKAEIGFKALSRASEVRHSLLRKSIAMELTRWHRVSNQSTVHLRRRTPRRPRSRSRTNCRRLQSTFAWYARG